jgi:hypothetical protein
MKTETQFNNKACVQGLCRAVHIKVVDFERRDSASNSVLFENLWK